MKSNSELLENLILQNINFKDVVNAFAEGDKFPILKNDLREQIQEKLAAITELEETYLSINISHLAYNKDKPSTDPIFWINLNELHQKPTLGDTITYINNSYSKAIKDYDELISQSNQNQVLFNLLQLQKNNLMTCSNRLNFHLVNQSA
jgi:hypothetical protein